MSVDQQFNIINDKLQQLLRHHNRLKKENERLRQELDEQRQNSATFQETIDGLQQQIALIKFAAGNMNEQDKKEFERKLNQYIREIDKCISYLSR